MASPTSWLGTSAAPVARMASSTCWASSCSWSSSTGRPWQARRTPATTLVRLNGSLTPLRLTTASTASSTVVNRRPHFGQDRRRRVVAPSSASRESMTRLSALWQNGQRIGGSPPLRSGPGMTGASVGRPPAVLWTLLGTSGGCPGENLRMGLWTGLQLCNY